MLIHSTSSTSRIRANATCFRVAALCRDSMRPSPPRDPLPGVSHNWGFSSRCKVCRLRNTCGLPHRQTHLIQQGVAAGPDHSTQRDQGRKETFTRLPLPLKGYLGPPCVKRGADSHPLLMAPNRQYS